jgi:hypothetical protein
MVQPYRIDALTVDDLRGHRWCYFQDDAEGFDAFEYVVPDTHPKFDENVMELELASFTFVGGEVRFGMFDGSKNFSVFLNGGWFSLWAGVREPSALEVQTFRNALAQEALVLPVEARARWSGASVTFGGLRYFNKNFEEVEANV